MNQLEEIPVDEAIRDKQIFSLSRWWQSGDMGMMRIMSWGFKDLTLKGELNI